ncbi:DegT/DnrJ/EryC1/StrS family aminotransferase [Candidatus Bathyarchaeota archaeon]|nr:DegT/DnrJ/EryC1/StrS family aminotransferase [Candidatus Bathyarchaeota archaeon]
MNDTLIRSSRPFFPKEDINYILADLAAVLEDGRLRNGKNLNMFENMIKNYLGIKYGIALDSDSSALETALNYYNVKKREVIVCTNSFISIPNSVLYAGGKVVFADIRKETLSMNPNDLTKKISKKTRGIIVTHIAGFPNPDLKEIQEICQKNSLFLIEDATHAFGATINNQKVGTFGDAAVFAFTPTKVLTTGEGGMLVTNDSDLANYARLYSYYGSGPGKTNFENLGRHMMMPEISAILGIYQLKRIEEFIAKRNQIASIYDGAFDQTGYFSTVKCPSGSRSSYYKYPLILGPKIDKAAFVKSLTNSAIETGSVFYPPCHMQPVYRKQKVKGLPLPIAEETLARTITLPMHLALSNLDVSKVVKNVQLALA